MKQFSLIPTIISLLLIIGVEITFAANDTTTVPITLYSSAFGEYYIQYHGTHYNSPASGSVSYRIPKGAQVQIVSAPHNKEYEGYVMWMKKQTDGTELRGEVTTHQHLTIDLPTTFDDNYRTKNPHVVYLAVPNNTGSWNSNAATHNCLYAFHYRTASGEGALIEMSVVDTVMLRVGNTESEHIYYRCTIPAGYNAIRFEKRTNVNAFGATDIATENLRYQIPLDNVNCYRLDHVENGKCIGFWESPSGFDGDYRLLHVRAAGVSYPSDVIRQNLANGNHTQIVSLHIYTENANEEYPKVELQQYQGGQWTILNTFLVKDISSIMMDTTDNGCGVWNFKVVQNNGTVSVDTANVQRYTGNYYIRTNNAEGGWQNYTIPANHMTFSSYAKANSGFTHYFCKWIDIDPNNNSTTPGKNNNVKFIVANDYGAVISNELAEDSYTASGGILPEDANVRWEWNEVTNHISRSYIGTNGIKATYSTGAATSNKHSNWVYSIDLTNIGQGSILSKLSTIYPSSSTKEQIFASNMPMFVTSQDNTNGYSIRLVYDFKINKTSIILLPDHTTATASGVDMFIDRTNHGNAVQVRSTIQPQEPNYVVYATMTFTQGHLEDKNKTAEEKLYYWVSFPFNVRISDVFDFGTYGEHWIMQYYDGAARAANGFWADSPTYWRYIDPSYTAGAPLEDANGNPCNGVLIANKGYVLALHNNIANKGLFIDGNQCIRLYFPPMTNLTSLDGEAQNTIVNLPEHICTIQRDNRSTHDSNWQIIGVPSYANNGATLNTTLYYYEFNPSTNIYNVTSRQNFKSMHAYMVQYAGTLNWIENTTPTTFAPRKNASSSTEHNLCLELQQDGAKLDQTYIALQNDNVTNAFDFNYDLSKIINAGANIYSLIPTHSTPIEVAANILPTSETTIPLGVVIDSEGEYTFSMPDGTDGITAELIDYETNVRTNLLLNDYTIDLTKGTYNNRFALYLQPSKVTTHIGHSNTGDNTTIRKFIINGTLYLQRNGVLYDAQGRIIK